jgi:hypothetical protein
VKTVLNIKKFLNASEETASAPKFNKRTLRRLAKEKKLFRFQIFNGKRKMLLY